MSSAQPRLLAAAQGLAEQFASALGPATERLVIAGSIRRQKPQVRDIEIVCIPRFESAHDLFGLPIETFSLVRRVLRTLPGVCSVIKDGPEYQQVAYHPDPDQRPIQLDIFNANTQNFGYILALRTGCAEFSQWLVVERAKGGAKPAHISLKGGYVREASRNGERTVSVPEEQDFFHALGLREVPLGDRERAYYADGRLWYL